MNKLAFGLVTAAVLAIAAPASAQLFIGADPYGTGVQVGPLGVGVGSRFSNDDYDGRRGYYDHRRGYDANAYYSGENCRLIRSRIVTPSGRVIYRTRQTCR